MLLNQLNSQCYYAIALLCNAYPQSPIKVITNINDMVINHYSTEFLPKTYCYSVISPLWQWIGEGPDIKSPDLHKLNIRPR